jgi:sulfoxide reductase heme-binding subunit YedZ
MSQARSSQARRSQARRSQARTSPPRTSPPRNLRVGSRGFLRLTKPPLFVLASAPAIWLTLGAFGLAGVDLGANPVERILDITGIWGLRVLLITLAVTPLRQWTGWNWLLAYRRMLGLFAFFYLLLHFLTYATLDLRWDLGAIAEDVLERPFITIGLTALLLLVPLAVTSTRGWMRRLGRRWQKLHRLIYPAAMLGVWHYYWQVKLDTLEPTVYAVVLLLLLGWRARSARQRRRRSRASRIDASQGVVDGSTGRP